MSGINLELKQLQKLVMTAELKQAIDLLTMPVLELQQFVREQMESNPVLEEGGASQISAEDAVFSSLKDNPSGEGDKSRSYVINTDDPFRYEARTEQFNSLYEYLKFQLNILPLSDKQKKIGKEIISRIDDNGYLLMLPGAIADELKLPAEEITEVMGFIRRFDPPGVCCVSLQDCLMLQLDKDDPYYEHLRRMITCYLDMVAANRVPQIARQLGLSVEEVTCMVETVRTLNPRPCASMFSSDEVEYITPDVTVKKIDGDWVVILNEWGVPKLCVSDYYANLVKTGADIDASTEEYLKEKMHSAIWVMKMIEQRRKTIYDTVNAIIKHQSAFFEGSADYPVPLNLKDISDEIGVHESTVSRAVSNKYIQMPKGMFSFKYFFPKGVAAGSDVNTLGVKKDLKDLIDAEDSAHPLKDQQLTEKLNAMGIEISRRTVAKYREQLGIPTAGKRKKF